MYAASPARRELGSVTVTDPLTGLYNERYLHERVAEELARSLAVIEELLAGAIRERKLASIARHLVPGGGLAYDAAVRTDHGATR